MSEQQTDKKPITKELVDKATVEQYYKIAEIRNDVRAIKGWVTFIGVVVCLAVVGVLLMAYFAAVQN
ncbi:MAG: hypothetical protein ACFCUH_00580 [Flavobacteriales bacterium]